MIQRKKGQEPNLPPDEKAQGKPPWAMQSIASTGWERPDSNWGPSPCKDAALPLRHAPETLTQNQLLARLRRRDTLLPPK